MGMERQMEEEEEEEGAYLSVNGGSGDVGGHGVVGHVPPRVVLGSWLRVPHVSTVTCGRRHIQSDVEGLLPVPAGGGGGGGRRGGRGGLTCDVPAGACVCYGLSVHDRSSGVVDHENPLLHLGDSLLVEQSPDTREKD